MSALHQAKTTSRKRKRIPTRHYPRTNFYPLYDFDRDQVNPVSGIRPIKLQRIIPRYELSASDTRDEGVGPIYEAMTSSTYQAETASAPIRMSRAKVKRVDNSAEQQRHRAGMFEFTREIRQARIIDAKV